MPRRVARITKECHPGKGNSTGAPRSSREKWGLDGAQSEQSAWLNESKESVGPSPLRIEAEYYYVVECLKITQAALRVPPYTPPELSAIFPCRWYSWPRLPNHQFFVFTFNFSPTTHPFYNNVD